MVFQKTLINQFFCVCSIHPQVRWTSMNGTIHCVSGAFKISFPVRPAISFPILYFSPCLVLSSSLSPSFPHILFPSLPTSVPLTPLTPHLFLPPFFPSLPPSLSSNLPLSPSFTQSFPHSSCLLPSFLSSLSLALLPSTLAHSFLYTLLLSPIVPSLLAPFSSSLQSLPHSQIEKFNRFIVDKL